MNGAWNMAKQGFRVTTSMSQHEREYEVSEYSKRHSRTNTLFAPLSVALHEGSTQLPPP